VDEDRVGPFGAEAVDSFLATVSGAELKSLSLGIEQLIAPKLTKEIA
jgi:hypothetical protein